ncbi:MAG: UDP-N-acetylmuramoyl-L-alanine--D-glutamate ligase [Anaerolineae bacterium]
MNSRDKSEIRNPKSEIQTVAVIGMGIEGGSLARYFLRQRADVTVHHWMSLEKLKEDPKLGPQYRELTTAGASFSTGKAYLTDLTKHDVVGILQSAFTYKYPENRPALDEVRNLGIPLVTNLSIFFDHCPAPIIGVTGTNGKSTTTEMAAAVLARGPRQVWAGGNLGASPLDALDDLAPEDLVVLELSNYQLEFLDESPWIAAVTNIAPDHLVDYDGDYGAYKAAKRRIMDFQSHEDWAVLNHDDPIAKAWHAACWAQPFPFSRQTTLAQGAFVRDDTIVVRHGDDAVTICQVDALQVRGGHNVENALCAAAIGVLAGISNDDIAAALLEYTLGEHKLEFVGEWSGVHVYNDSKSTSPSSTLAAVRAFPDQPVILLAGGRDKGLPWDELAQVVHESCKEVIVFGEARDMLEQAFGDFGFRMLRPGSAQVSDFEEPRRRPFAKLRAGSGSVEGTELTVKKCESLDEAVETAFSDAQPGDVVLLSPACTSFDAFDNYAERGRHFKQLVISNQ